jgi:hypothetical protein
MEVQAAEAAAAAEAEVIMPDAEKISAVIKQIEVRKPALRLTAVGAGACA